MYATALDSTPLEGDIPATFSPKGRWAGRGLLIIAAVHSIFGLLAGARIIPDPQMQALIGDRAVLSGMVPPLGVSGQLDLAQMLLFWFFAFGVALIPLGLLVHHLERSGQRVPQMIAAALVGLALLGGLFIPASGFWLALLPAWNIWRKN